MSHADPLLSPFKLKNLTLKNRIMSTSHACGLEEEGGMPAETYQRYHEEKARGGLALTMFGGSSYVAQDSTWKASQLNVGTDRIIPYLQSFSERVHAHGAALMVQITHLGRRGETSTHACSLIKQAHDHRFAELYRHGGNTHIDRAVEHTQGKPAVLRQAFLRYIKTRHQLQTLYQGGGNPFFVNHLFLQDTIHPLTDAQHVLIRLDVDVGGLHLYRILKQRLQQFDDEAGDSDEDLWEEKELTFVPSKPSAALDTLVATASSAPSCC